MENSHCLLTLKYNLKNYSMMLLLLQKIYVDYSITYVIYIYIYIYIYMNCALNFCLFFPFT